ncbi:hypothetical protein NEMIN01_0801 [Nematocida minor]|uniref:uncharacterized protein n=1 Tax=Nematocida minor TaxID=1912983 RepID=UPI00221F8611|nr:uncharacterized protein NEMIN01_0801 [Nematocida minor]KAI5190016.1 hypothetical protein NEMIN01_0801 [Nematocida minor]
MCMRGQMKWKTKLSGVFVLCIARSFANSVYSPFEEGKSLYSGKNSAESTSVIDREVERSPSSVIFSGDANSVLKYASECSLEKEKKIVIKKHKKDDESSEELLLQCNPLVFGREVADSEYSEEAESSMHPPLGENKDGTFRYLFGDVWVKNKPYIYDSANKPPLQTKIASDVPAEKPSLEKYHANILKGTKDIFTMLKRPEVMNLFYCFLVVISIISTYQLEKLEISHATKDAVKKGINTMLSQVKDSFFSSESDRILNSPEISAYLKMTKNSIVSQQFLIAPGLIDLKKVQEIEKTLFQEIKNLGFRGSELPMYIYRFAEACMQEMRIPFGHKYEDLTRIINLHVLAYSYEAMLSVLKDPKTRNIDSEHLNEAFRVFGSEITEIVLAARKYFSESKILEAINK